MAFRELTLVLVLGSSHPLAGGVPCRTATATAIVGVVCRCYRRCAMSFLCAFSSCFFPLQLRSALDHRMHSRMMWWPDGIFGICRCFVSSKRIFASALFLIKVSFQKLSTEAVYILFFMHVSINLVQLNTFIAVPIEVQFVKFFGF